MSRCPSKPVLEQETHRKDHGQWFLRSPRSPGHFPGVAWAPAPTLDSFPLHPPRRCRPRTQPAVFSGLETSRAFLDFCLIPKGCPGPLGPRVTAVLVQLRNCSVTEPIQKRSPVLKSPILQSNEGLITQIKWKSIITFQNKSINIC